MAMAKSNKICHRSLTILVLIVLLVNESSAFVAHLGSASSHRRTRTRSDIVKLYYDPNPDDAYDRVDVSTIVNDGNTDDTINILDWLEHHLLSSDNKQLQRSDPDWIGADDILDISHSMLIQEHLESLFFCKMNDTPNLFPTEWSKHKFDFDWRCIFLKSMPEVTQILETGRCNSHPLRLQLVAIPPHTSLPLHVHATGELDIPLVGELWERRSDILLSADTLCRQPEHSIGTPLSDFSAKPTQEELDVIRDDLSDRVVLSDYGTAGSFRTRKVTAGECLINPIGSVHQSFTKDKPCLMWVLGANVHAHFRPGNFHQREGIQDLTGIDDLLV